MTAPRPPRGSVADLFTAVQLRPDLQRVRVGKSRRNFKGFLSIHAEVQDCDTGETTCDIFYARRIKRTAAKGKAKK